MSEVLESAEKPIRVKSPRKPWVISKSFFLIKLASPTNSLTTKVFETDLNSAIEIAEHSWERFGNYRYVSHEFFENQKMVIS